MSLLTDIPIWRPLLHPGAFTLFNAANHAQTDISAATSAIACPVRLSATTELDLAEAYVTSGASTGFRCRIVTASATTGLPTDTLAHANATATITASAAAWNQFDWTNFTLSPGDYWLVFDSPTGLTTTLRMETMADYRANEQTDANYTTRYWTGSAWAIHNISFGAVRVRLKAAAGWLYMPLAAPQIGASGINYIFMDTLENPLCRGGRLQAPFSGKLVGFDWSLSGFTANTSFELVLATEGCAAELARTEVFQPTVSTSFRTYRIRFPAVDVVKDTHYDFYIKAGSQATTAGGIAISALSVSDHSGAVIECYGVPQGALRGLAVHNPPTEGGADTPTVTSDHVFPAVPVYGSITTSAGGGGSARARAFST